MDSFSSPDATRSDGFDRSATKATTCTSVVVFGDRVSLRQTVLKRDKISRLCLK
jgi:hypothetical protein